MKKKILSFLVAVCLFIPCLFMLTACGGDVTGVYKVSTITVGEVSWNKSKYESKKESSDLSNTEEMISYFFAMNFTIELKEDNKYVMTITSDDEVETMEEGTWAQEGKKLTLTPTEMESEEDIHELTITNGKLVMVDNFTGEEMTMVLSQD